MKVFLSSTYIDLIEHRKAVVSGLRTMGEDVDHMEVFGARNEEPTKASLDELEECDVLVGIYAYRYGTIPKGSKTSVTELEYLHAMSKKIPLLVFVVNEDHDWPPKKIDESLTKIKKFKSKASSEHTPAYFTTPDNLATQVVAAVGKLAKKPKAKKRAKSSSSHRELVSKEAVKGVRNDVRGSTLPNQPYFFGREKELAIIADAISPESRTWGALIDGPGGIGKTALAIRAAHLAPTTLFERKIFITAKVRELTPEGEKPLKDFSRDNYFSMLNELALELGEEGIPRLAPDERANPLRMAMAGKKNLIVFDNLETLSEDERTRLFQFLSRLPEGNKAIATSRRRRSDSDARAIRLDRLSADEALQLMSELAKNNSRLERENEKARRDLYEIANGNPLLIKWVCGQLGREGSAMHTITEACKFIENAPEGNDPLEYIFGDLLETFTGSETKVLAALTHFTQPAKLKWITDMADLAEQTAETALDDLNDRSLLITNAETHEFFLPSLASQYIRSKRPEIVRETGIRLTDQIYSLTYKNGWLAEISGDYQGFRILEAEWLYIAAGIPLVMHIETKREEFYGSIRKFLDFTGRFDEWLWLCNQLEQQGVIEDNPNDAGQGAFDASWIYINRRQVTEALECAKRAESYWGALDKNKKALVLFLFGHIYNLQNDYSTSIKTYKEVLSMADDDNSIEIDLCSTLNSLAESERALGDRDAAETHTKEALSIATKDNNEEGIATISGNLATLFLDKENWVDAERLSIKALDVSEKLGIQDSIALNSLRLATAIAHQGREDEGITYARRAVRLFAQLRSARLTWAQNVLMAMEAELEIPKKKTSRSTRKKR